MTMKFHILNLLYDLESHAKDGRCGLSRNEDIRRLVGKLVEKQTLEGLSALPDIIPYDHYISCLHSSSFLFIPLLLENKIILSH